MAPQAKFKNDGNTSAVEDNNYKSLKDPSTTSKSTTDSMANLGCSKLLVHPTVSLPILNFLDMFSVALVVPLMNEYFKDAGVTSANQRELLSSLYSGAQIVGGLLMGALSDTGFLSRKNTLYLSFIGSALSYSLIVFSGVKGLIVSRLIVGLVKQTGTITTSMMSSYTTIDDRSRYIGRLNASSTMGFIVGPSAGAFLYKHVDRRAPALLSSLIFVINFILAAFFIPNEKGTIVTKQQSMDQKDSKGNSSRPTSKANKFSKFSSNIKSCFTSSAISSVIVAFLIYNFMYKATAYDSMSSFYEEMYGIEPHHRGYIRSYRNILSFLFQTFFVQSLFRLAGGEYMAACLTAAGLGIASLLELGASLHLFLIVICPILAVSHATLRLSLRSLITQVAPKESLGSILAALDVLLNAASVAVPFYRSMLFRLLICIEGEEDVNAAMEGDPCPRMWLKSSLVHWIFATMCLCSLLLSKKRTGKELLDSTNIKKKQ